MSLDSSFQGWIEQILCPKANTRLRGAAQQDGGQLYVSVAMTPSPEVGHTVLDHCQMGVLESKSREPGI